MIAALCNFQHLLIAAAAYPVDQPMLTVDTTRPPSAHVVLERLRFAYAKKRLALTFADKFVNTLEQARIVRLKL